MTVNYYNMDNLFDNKQIEKKEISEINSQPLQGGKVKIKRVRIPNMAVLQSKVKQYIIGQDEAVNRVILSIYRSLKIRNVKTNMLIIGKSGSGKTETMKQIARALKIPYTIEDATKYTKEGFVGKSVEDMIYNLYDNSDWDLEKTERGMLIIDEIDKKVSNRYDSDISGRDVLNSLLKIIEGTRILLEDEVGMLSEYVDTSKMIVVFMGAFEGIEEIRKKRLRSGKNESIGFNVNQKVSYKEGNESGYTKEDLIKFGLPVEFVGRIDTIIEYKQLSEESLSKIARNSKLSIFRKYEKYLAKNGITLKYEDSIFDEIAKKALQKNTGAREISNVTNEIFESILSEVFIQKKGKYKECILKKNFVQNPTEYELK